MSIKSVKTIVTLGLSTNSEKCLRIIKDKGVDFVRVNMSHSSIGDLDRFLRISKSVGIPFIIDTEGSQIRTGALENENIYFNEYQKVKIFKDEIVGNSDKISIKPGDIVNNLQEGDLLHIDFDALTLQIIDSSTIKLGYIIAMVISKGGLGSNKAVLIDPRYKVGFNIPPLTNKDYRAIELGLKMGVKHIAVSYVRSGESVEIVRKATQNKMAVISKIECFEALQNLDTIIQNSDYLLLDRGDLSKEIPIRKIPFIQKMIINKARNYNKGVFIATNLLESMIEKQNPTRAEVHDVIISILDGAEGLTLAAETAIGKHPLKCINILNDLINHVDSLIDLEEARKDIFKYYDQLMSSGYLLDITATSLVSPHGGKLIDRYREELSKDNYLGNHTKIKLDITKQIEIEQIATGVFSPLEGFMNEDDFHSVVERLQLSNGEIWPLPVVLDVTEKEADTLRVGEDVALANTKGEAFSVLHLETKYRFDKDKTAERIYGTCTNKHPGVKMMKAMKPILLSGKINLISWRRSPTMGYELTPKQTRKLFEGRGWVKIVGFHTRNIPHKGHEFILRSVVEDECCDGVFVHPVVGKKKDGDFSQVYILKSYEKLIRRGFLFNKVVLAAFPTFSRYAGPREAVFTAICRKNYGCSHFIVGRDHTGTGNFFDDFSSQDIFSSLPNLGIKIIKVDEAVYSKGLKKYFFQKDYPPNNAKDKTALSGTLVRDYFLAGEKPPDWLMESEISEFILKALAKSEQVFIKS